MKKLCSITFVGLCFALSLRAQSFQNLNFEGAWNNGSIPGWTASWYNEFTDFQLPVGPTTYIEPASFQPPLDVNLIQLVNSTSPGYPGPIQGKQSLFLMATPYGGPGYASISQTGTVPTGTKSLTFSVLNPFGHTVSGQEVYDAPELAVSFAGNELTLVPLSNPAVGTVVTYSADISAYAGLTGSLVISAVDGPNQQMNGVNEDWAEIDGLQFSNTPTPVPEASSFSVCAASLCLLAGLLQKKSLRATSTSLRVSS